MNFNDYPEELKKEEQIALDHLISKMDRIINSLDDQMKMYVREAKNADISINPDLYLSRLLAAKGRKNTDENRKKFLQARDELYHTRLLLQYEDEQSEGTEEIKIGLHSCLDKDQHLVISWTMPLCRHYILDNAAIDYESIVTGKHGEKYHTYYTLLVKNQVKLRFTHVMKVMNLFPGVFDKDDMKKLKGEGYFSDAFLDEMIQQFNPDEYDPDSAAKIISDEFLQELLERRSTPEFKNIVFSIQKKQGEIIQAPYERHMVVQGCAGSGKSMIMMHRLPILLYDNPNSLSRTNLYIITPSQMYIQLAENMRNQLEISDINMGTIEQYYDHCISKYSGHKGGEYGKINWGSRLSIEHEQYIYSASCIDDIIGYFDHLGQDNGINLENAYSILKIKKPDNRRLEKTYSQKTSNRLLNIQSVLNANNDVLVRYFKGIRSALDALEALSTVLRIRKIEVLRKIAKLISGHESEIVQAEYELGILDAKKNSVAIQNRQNTIEAVQKRIEEYEQERDAVEKDTDYFASLEGLNAKLENVIAPFKKLKNEFGQNTTDVIYEVVDKTGQLIGGYYMMSWELSKIEDKYIAYVDPISRNVQKAGGCIEALQEIKDQYIDCEYYSKIINEREALSVANTHAVMNAYEMIMENIGISRTENGYLRAIKSSPYIYLQTLYQYYGAPAFGWESLLPIDEAQGIAPEEIRLISNVNGGKAIFNMYGDVYQHVEGTKGVESWDEFKNILDFDVYEMQENYRNASQITDYCNRKFNMNMIAINTPGKGVHEIRTDKEFEDVMISQLLDTQRAGLAAILVSNDAEVRCLMSRFVRYEQKFHNMTDEDFNIHRTRWNIININDAKGLEFSSVIALSGRMSRNQKYIAYTRALDDLYVYEEALDITEFEKKPKNKVDPVAEIADTEQTENPQGQSKHINEKPSKNYKDSEVREYFEKQGLIVIDKRDAGGRLWVIGEKTAIRDKINGAIAKFKISGKYTASSESGFKNGWCTKTDK